MVNPEHYNTLFSLAQDLIRIPSPPGQERDVAEYLQRTMGEMGFTEVQSDKYGNVIGRISFSNDGPVLLFEGGDRGCGGLAAHIEDRKSVV